MMVFILNKFFLDTTETGRWGAIYWYDQFYTLFVLLIDWGIPLIEIDAEES